MAAFDYYRELQVARDASPDEIRAAFRRLAVKYHPDRNPGNKSAEEKFKRIAEAFDVLNDPQKRAVYDRGGMEDVREEPGFRHFKSVEDIFSSFGDVFGDLFGDRVHRQATPQQGENYETELSLSGDEALSGGRKSFTIDEDTACGACGGTGMAGGETADCPACRGSGYVSQRANRLGGFFSVSRTCPECGGHGRLGSLCSRCDGGGIRGGPRAVELTVPKGVEDGTVLRLKSMGAPGRRGGVPGDLLVRVRISDRAGCEREASVRVTVDLATAVLGGKVRLPAENGAVEIRIPAGTQPGQVLRHVGRDGRGDLLVAVDVEIPRKVSERQRRLLEEFRRAGS